MINTGNVLACFCGLFGLLANGAGAEQLLVEFGQGFDISKVKATDAEISLSSEDDGALRVDTGHDANWPGVTIRASAGHWDLSEYGYLALDVKNVGSKRTIVSWRVDSPGGDGVKNSMTKRRTLAPGEKKTMRISLQRTTAQHSRQALRHEGIPRRIAEK
ncbi:hypothetical protein ACFL6S_05355 [Candidatus Poribacteria bacterium]